jgi:hypothetical protein
MIRMRMGVNHRINVGYFVFDRLVSQIRAGINEDRLSRL